MKTILKIYASVLGQPGLLLRLGGLMMVILVIYQTALTLFLGSLHVPGDLGETQQALMENWQRLALGFVVYGVIAVWLTTIFAIRWHRNVLLGQDRYSLLDVTFGSREWRFVWNSIIIALITGIATVIFFTVARLVFSILASVTSLFSVMQVALWLSILLFANYLIGRLSLVFPAVALGVPMRVRDSWHKTWDEGVRVMWLLTAVSLPALIAPELVFQLLGPSGLPPWISTAITTFVQVFFLLITTALFAGTFSYTYQRLGLPLSPPQSFVTDSSE